MNKSTFIISKMDCSSEEQLIRMKLQDLDSIKSLQFDIPHRKLDVWHTEDNNKILQSLEILKLEAKLVGTEIVPDDFSIHDEKVERRIFLWVFIINFSFFTIEIVTGLLSNSMGLVADSLDMLADAIIFGISLFVVGAADSKKKMVAKISGYFQLTLAIFGFIEIVKRFLGFEMMPDYKTMIVVSSFALIGNAFSLYLIQKAKSKSEAHIRAGKIFLSNDIFINFGIILAGILVLLLSSKLPDLMVGSIIFIIVGRGAFRILQLAK